MSVNDRTLLGGVLHRVLELVARRRRVDRDVAEPLLLELLDRVDGRVELVKCSEDALHQCVHSRCRRGRRVPSVSSCVDVGADASMPRRHDLLDLGDRHHRQLLDEQQEPHEEPAEAAEQDAVVDPRRAVRCPTATARTRARATAR